jgi:hypothetical protein
MTVNSHSTCADLLTWEVEETELDLAVGPTGAGLHYGKLNDRSHCRCGRHVLS